MPRSLKKGPFVAEHLLKKIERARSGASRAPIKTWSRDSTVIPDMVGFTIGVHNGKTHIPVLIVENMVGHKLGEFSATRKFTRHGGKMQKEIETKKAEVEQAASKAATAPATGAPAKK
ncbi:MAG: 30S ribosomal protein S19 [bacterium]|nr:30S ribosomal protein S19 [bacterium]